MRIVAGKWRGRRLAELGAGDAEAHLRPTTDRVRESLFNTLGGGKFGAPIDGARVLDLFAGTGALGLEALSRGAASAVFVDTGLMARALLRKNIALCQAQGIAKILRRSATDLGPHTGAPFDLIFLDPPYGTELGAAALAAAKAGGWIAPGALVVWEDSVEPPPPAGLIPLDRRRYGNTTISFFRAPEE